MATVRLLQQLARADPQNPVLLAKIRRSSSAASSAREARTVRIPAAAYRTGAARTARLRRPRPFTFTLARWNAGEQRDPHAIFCTRGATNPPRNALVSRPNYWPGFGDSHALVWRPATFI